MICCIINSFQRIYGRAYGSRTRHSSVKGRCINRFTNAPCPFWECKYRGLTRASQKIFVYFLNELLKPIYIAHLFPIVKDGILHPYLPDQPKSYFNYHLCFLDTHKTTIPTSYFAGIVCMLNNVLCIY